MKVETKLWVALAVVGLFLVAVQIAALVVIGRLSRRLNEISRTHRLAGEVASALQAYRIAPQAYREHLARLEDLGRLSESEAELKLLAQARVEVQTGRPLTALETLGQHYRQAIEQGHNDLVKMHRRIVAGLAVILVDSVLLAAILAFLVRVWLLQPLRIVSAAATEVAAGNRQRRVSRVGGEEFVRVADAINQMAGQLEQQQEAAERQQRLSALGEACSYVTHNVRSLLGSICSLAQQESRAPETPADARVGFNYIIALAQKLDQWVRDMHSSLSPVNPRRTAQELEPILHDLMTLMEPKISEKGLKVDFQVADELPRVPVDRGLFEQAVLAILTNAIEAAPDNSRLGVRLAAGNGEVAVEIEDAGPGMDEETRARACRPYFTTKSGSAGLGLTIAHQIVLRHDGRLEIDTAPGRGTRTRLWWPAMKSA